MKKKPTGALGKRYEKTPKTLKIAPDAPNDATDKDEPKKVGMAKEANDEITAEFKYIVVKLETPKYAIKVDPNDCKASMLTKKWKKFWWENADPNNDQED